MKIGVITYWAGNSNYGMMLQCWAFQHYLKEQGHDPYVIRFIKNDKRKVFRRIIKGLDFLNISKRLMCLYKKEKYIDVIQNNKKRDFDSFRKKALSFSAKGYSSIKELQEHPPMADCYITGSDQVWSQLLDDYENTAFFLNFGDKGVLRISYAASFSMTKYPYELNGKLAKMLSNMDYISVREYDGIEICKQVGYKAIKVLDPTLLLDKSDYLNLCKTITSKIKNFIFIYSLNIASSSDIRWEELKNYGIERSTNFIVTPSDGYFIGGELFGSDVEYEYATIEEWLAFIRDAQLVVTSSFHGVALSIIMETPFIYIPLKGRFSTGNNRVLDLLKELHLENRILNDDTNYLNIINNNINWQSVKRDLTLYKNESISFLKKSLSK